MRKFLTVVFFDVLLEKPSCFLPKFARMLHGAPEHLEFNVRDLTNETADGVEILTVRLHRGSVFVEQNPILGTGHIQLQHDPLARDSAGRKWEAG